MAFSEFSIRTIKVSPGLVLAPMSGVTTSAFRRLIKELNPGAVGLVVSEFISVEGLTRGGMKSHGMMKFHELERPFGIQIFGHDVARMRDAAAMVEEAGADLVDINCGCPAPKVVKRGGGCELMRQPLHLAQILREVRKAVSIPLTIKFRSGWDEQSKNALEIARIAEAEGVEGLTVHGRTRAALYRGSADWDIVREVKESVSIPVCGSGDVVDKSSAIERLRFGVDGLYIGRGALENPFVFSEVLSGESVGLRTNDVLRVQVLERYLELLLEDFSPSTCVGKLKQLCSQVGKGTRWAKAFCRVMTLEEQCLILLKVKEGSWTPDEQLILEERGAPEEKRNGNSDSTTDHELEDTCCP